MKLTRYGRREWLGSLMLAFSLICLLFCLTLFTGFPLPAFAAASLLILLVWSALAAFFRDPDRKVPADPAVLLSPADGVVRDIELIKGDALGSEQLTKLFQGRDVLRIGIFLSVFNVHLNRAPAAMKAVFREYKPGAFHDARDGRATKENESMLLGASARFEDLSFPLAVRQISGAIARRIVCPVEPGMEFAQGERYGMIKFGSRTELYLPAGAGIEVTVKVGDPVTAGISPLARICSAAREKLRTSPFNDAGAQGAAAEK